MPRSAEQLESTRQESRDAIMAAALRLFGERGYAATSIRMIAGEAGISQGLLYNYYDGKEALLHAIFERSMADVQRSFDVAAAGATPRDRIERLIASAFDLVAQDLAFWRLTYQLRMQRGVVEGLAEHVRAWSNAIRQYLEELLRAAGVAEPDVQARVLHGVIDGAAQHYALDPDHYPVDDVTRAITERFVPPALRKSKRAPKRTRTRSQGKKKS